MHDNPSRATLRKRKSRARETSDQVDNHRACDRETKRLKSVVSVKLRYVGFA